jgi:hypothetical protein
VIVSADVTTVSTCAVYSFRISWRWLTIIGAAAIGFLSPRVVSAARRSARGRSICIISLITML